MESFGAFSRRNFLKSAAISSAISAMPLGSQLAFGAVTPAHKTIITLLLRGGQDGLKLLAPADDSNYVAARPDGLRVTASGTGAGLSLAHGPSANDWRLNPNAAPLKDLYDHGSLAFVTAVGLQANTRSHFEAVELIETGWANLANVHAQSGWLTRYTQLLGAVPVLGAIALSDQAPVDWRSSASVVAMSAPTSFTLNSTAQHKYFSQVYSGSAPLAAAGQATLTALDAVAAGLQTLPATTTVIPDGFTALAQLINMNIGLKAVTIVYDGWDTHTGEETRFNDLITKLSTDLTAFWAAIPNHQSEVVVMTLTDFGRRVKSNADGGTDHGRGQVMMLLGAGIAGHKIFGTWNGLAPAVLDQGDVPATTDLRQVMWEIVAPTLPGHGAGDLFPGFTATKALGVYGPPAA